VNVLIAGASGLVGGRLVRCLASSRDIHIRATSRSERLWPPGVEGCVADLGRPETLTDACSGIDVVVNLSSMPERLCAADPQGALRVNGGGTLALVSAAAEAAVQRFVHLSTSKVYGKNLGGLVTEATACQPQSHYGITHHLAECYVRTQFQNSVSFRLANGFGAPVDDTRGWNIILNSMCREAVVHRRITITTSGQTWRNFVPLQDVVRALHFAITGLPRGTYNLGAHESMTLRAAAQLVSEICSDALNFLPSISTGTGGAGEDQGRLDYSIKKLADTGFNWTGSTGEEIRDTLLIAHRAFGPHLLG